MYFVFQAKSRKGVTLSQDFLVLLISPANLPKRVFALNMLVLEIDLLKSGSSTDHGVEPPGLIKKHFYCSLSVPTAPAPLPSQLYLNLAEHWQLDARWLR